MPPTNALGTTRTSLLVCAAVGLTTGVLAAGCAKKAVVVAAEPPPLSVPVVPPRLVGPVVVEEVQQAPQPTVEEQPERPAATRTAPRPTRATRGPTDATPKPADGSAADSAKSEPATEPANAEHAPMLLRTPDTADDQEAIRRVKEILTRAEANLAKVNYRTLSTAAKGQHDTASRFITQAEDALRKRSYTFAIYLADKAEIISGSLLNR